MNSTSPRPWQSITIVLIVIGILALALGGYLTPITRAVLTPITPVQSWLSTRFQAFQTVFTAPNDTALIQQRNAELEAEIARLQTQIIELQQQVTEVEILTSLLDFAKAQPENDYEAAAVIGQDPSPFLKYIIINKGSDDGLRRGMPVVSEQGLVGRIAAVTANAANVQLITDPAAVVNVRIQPAEVDATLQGSITSEITLDLIPQDAEIQPGDLILTSGLGGNYPANILVGQIASVRQQATALFQTASVQPVVDFERIEIVLIIVNFQPIDISPLIPEPTPVP
ncbi:MAG: rod shape-determining protein MreC [Chloroflexi bacterium]|nr:MAG: rod shape-determining protein MreC [Chloroflexota bacterium]MBL1196496.1 rod shape-determining protein MreC [Chloroflexota bacterium]NOH13791.1 rod shape-determining protein MreC [Chloroflexota bacterium]